MRENELRNALSEERHLLSHSSRGLDARRLELLPLGSKKALAKGYTKRHGKGYNFSPVGTIGYELSSKGFATQSRLLPLKPARQIRLHPLEKP